jgi:sugar phosphate isomerase/epimerase
MSMMLPRLAMCNFMSDVFVLKRFALANGFSGVDWTFKVADLPRTPLEETRLLKKIGRLHPLEVRYHCAFSGIDLGDVHSQMAQRAMELFQRVCCLVAKLDGRYMTIHVGLGRDSTEGLSWERSLEALADLVNYGKSLGISVCLENLAWGWSSRPELFEKLVRKSQAGVTVDIGHARVSPSVKSQQYAFEDFVAPHPEKVVNAHVYHQEWEDGHVPPQHLDDIRDRLNVLIALPCNWWVLELREPQALLATLDIVRGYLSTMPDRQAHASGFAP